MKPAELTAYIETFPCKCGLFIGDKRGTRLFPFPENLFFSVSYKTGLAERVGFEPTKGLSPLTRLAIERLRPLGHLSPLGGKMIT